MRIRKLLLHSLPTDRRDANSERSIRKNVDGKTETLTEDARIVQVSGITAELRNNNQLGDDIIMVLQTILVNRTFPG